MFSNLHVVLFLSAFTGL